MPVVRHGVGRGYPVVVGKCPACGGASLFLGSGGYVTCSRLDCSDPCAATDILEMAPRPKRDFLPIHPGDVICPFRGWLSAYEHDNGDDPFESLAAYARYVHLILSTGGDGQ